MAEYSALFNREHDAARNEWMRLCQLFRDAVWYNFETRCCTWKPPWYPSYPDSILELNAMRFEQVDGYELCTFPHYYCGPVRDAPPLPPRILLEEVYAARRYMEYCREQVTAPWDYAPGGRKYNEIAERTQVGRDFSSV